MAVAVTFRIASFGLTILGSGVVSTRTSCFRASITRASGLSSIGLGLNGTGVGARRGVRRLGVGDLPGLDQHFQAAKVAVRRTPGSFWNSLEITSPSAPPGGS